MTSPSLLEAIKKRWQSVILGFYFSNLLIAFSAAALTILTWLFVGTGPIDWSIVSISGLCTYIIYGLHYWFDRVKKPGKVSHSPRGTFFDRYKHWLLGIFILSAIALVVLIWKNFSLQQYLLFIIISDVSLLYSFNIFNLFGLQRLRNNRWLKLMVLSGTWAAITVLIWWPYLLHHGDMLWLFVSRWSFMLAICIPFDVRDTFHDRRNMNTQTLYDSIGLKPLLLLGLASLFVSFLLVSFVITRLNFPGLFYFTATLGYMGAAGLICNTFKHPKNDWNYLYLDGYLIFYPLLMLFTSHFY